MGLITDDPTEERAAAASGSADVQTRTRPLDGPATSAGVLSWDEATPTLIDELVTAIWSRGRLPMDATAQL